MADLDGTCDERFAAVRDALAESLDNDDVGASVAVFVDGEPVVDLWGGYADPDRTRPWERDTITNVWSTTKTMTALCALILADRGEIDLDAPVATYWPEFVAAGKEGVLVRHVLGHTAGLPTWTCRSTLEQLYDWPTVTALLGRPGAHARNQAPSARTTPSRRDSSSARWSEGSPVAASAGSSPSRSPGRWARTSTSGCGAEHDHRVAPVIPPATRAPEIEERGPGNPPIPAETANTEAWRRADIPSANGFGNARSVAAVQSVLASGGEVRGVRLLSAAGCERVLEEQFAGEDQVLGAPIRYGMGYAVRGRTCSWGGWGGSIVLVDLEQHLTVSYVMNQMLEQGPMGDDRGLSVVMAAYSGL